MELLDSGLFAEVAEVVGHDPSYYEDIPKQHLTCTKSYIAETGVNMDEDTLLDQLMAANGLDLSCDNIDLADIDELDFAMKSCELPHYLLEQNEYDMLADVDFINRTVAEDEYTSADSPMSTISTLASEPSSPADFSEYQLRLDSQQHNELHPTSHSDSAPEHDLNSVLQSLTRDTLGDISCYLDQPDTYTDLDTSCEDSSYLTQPADDSDKSVADNASSPVFLPNVSISSHPKKSKAKKKKTSSTPYSKLPAGRKERKKRQNKEAAIRYREKKRGEAQSVFGEEAQLVQRNNELKTEVLNLEREILCMKELLSDVFSVHSL